MIGEQQQQLTMAAVVAPAEPVTAMESSVPEVDDRPLDKSEMDDEEDEHEEEPAKEWDEGGKSHCGYNEFVHETLMKIGETIHKVVGDPSAPVNSAMKGIGNWFQEASYAVRDVKEGKMDVADETVQAIKSMVSGEEDDKRDGDGGDGTGADDQYDAPPFQPEKEDSAEAPKLV